MSEDRSQGLLASLEQRAATALEALAACQARLSELESRLDTVDAQRRELAEENRTLSAQNRELEEANARLRERLAESQPAPPATGGGRPSPGLAALLGARSRAATPRAETSAVTEATAAATGTGPVPAQASAVPPGPSQQSSQQPSQELPPAPRPETPGGTTAPPAEAAPTPEALLAQWYQRYPRTFLKGHTQPLKVGIHHDLAAREPWPEKLVRRALAGYVNLPRYLKGVREGVARLGLDGAPSGTVDAEAAGHARRKLERLRVERQRRSATKGQADRASARRVAAPQTPGSVDSGSGRAKGKKTESQRAESGAAGVARRPSGSRPAAPHSSTEPSHETSPETLSETTETLPPAERLEAKLAALLAKHGGRR